MAFAAGVALLAFNFSATRNNSLSLTFNNQPPRPITWFWLDAASLGVRGGAAQLEGVLWNDSSEPHTFAVTSDGQVELWLGNTLVYSRPAKGEVVTETFEVTLPAGASPLKLLYTLTSPITPRFEVSLKEGGRLIPPWRLYTSTPTPETVSAQRRAWILLWVGLGLVAASFVAGVVLELSSFNLARIELILIAGILAIAIVVRIVVALERYQVGPDYYAMVSIWDNFGALGRSLLSGQYALAGSYYQQGAIVYTALSQIAVGPSLLNQYLLNAALGGLVCGLILGAGWALFGRTSGLLAGLFMALYPPLIHYQTTLQIVVPATLAASFVVAFGAWLIRRPGVWPAIGYGLAVGLAALSRSTLITLALAGPLAVAVAPANLPKARRLLIGSLTLVSFIAAVLPMTLANIRVGVYSFSSGGFPIAFFRGNNRDIMGLNEYYTDRELLARLRSGDEKNFNPETWRDLRADPGRWAQLMLHKVGLFWSGHEYSDRMIDFYTTGLAYSAMLRGLWLGGVNNFFLLAGLAGFGLVMALRDSNHRSGALVLGVPVIGFMAMTVIFSVTGRVRTPIHPALFPLTGFGVTALVNGFREWRVQWRPVLLAAATVTVAGLVILYFETQLPRPTVVAEDGLPSSLLHTDVDFDSTLRLIGFDALDSDYKPGGYLDITLYWQALRPLAKDYTVFLHLLDPTFTKAAGNDNKLGYANAPIYPAKQWPAGEIVRQSYVLKLPDTQKQGVPFHLIVGVYDAEKNLPVTASTVEVLNGTSAIISGLAVLPPMGVSLTAPARLLNVVVGDELRVTASLLPAESSIDPAINTLLVGLDWQVLTQPRHRYHLFLHLLDSSEQLVTQFDGPPQATFPTDTWPPNSYWRGGYTLSLPPDLPAGEYQLVAGVYNVGDLQRLPLGGDPQLLLPDNRFLLSVVRIER